MAKKCIPGIICIENITILFLFIILFGLSFYLLFTKKSNPIVNTSPILIQTNPTMDPTLPPLGTTSQLGTGPDIIDALKIAASGVGVPINIHTRGEPSSYQQVGILTKGELILPLYGRQMARDKKQYYTITNSGGIQTKLPVSINGKSCTGEYGCDEVFNNDNFFVEGYKDTFSATLYEKGENRYIPYI